MRIRSVPCIGLTLAVRAHAQAAEAERTCLASSGPQLPLSVWDLYYVAGHHCIDCATAFSGEPAYLCAQLTTSLPVA